MDSEYGHAPPEAGQAYLGMLAMDCLLGVAACLETLTDRALGPEASEAAAQDDAAEPAEPVSAPRQRLPLPVASAAGCSAALSRCSHLHGGLRWLGGQGVQCMCQCEATLWPAAKAGAPGPA